MNARMRELAKQSSLWFVVDREDLIDAFGRLVVQECLDCVGNDLVPNGPYKAITEHFGMNEPQLNVGDRIEVLKGFSVGAKGEIKYIEPNGKLWVRRDLASSDVFYMPEEVKKL